MKRKIRVMSLFIVVVMIASLFSACGDTGSPESEGTVELTWWHWGNAPSNADAAMKALNEKSQKDIGVTIEFIWASTDDSRLKTALSTGTKDDIAFTCAWFTNYLSAAQNNQFADITELVKAQKELWDFVPDWGWDAVTVNDKIYAVPNMKDSASEQLWIANKDYVIEEAGLEKEFFETNDKVSSVTPLLRKLKAYADAGHPYPADLSAPYNIGKGGFNGDQTGWDIIQEAVHIGDKIDEEGIKIVSVYEDPDQVAVYKELATWYKEGLLNQDCAQLADDPDDFVVISYPGWEGSEAIRSEGKDYDVVINKKYGPVATRSTLLGSANAVFANSEHKEAAVKYLAYINTNKEYRDMLAYGAPDVNFKYIDDGARVEILNNDFQPSAFAQATTWILTPAAPSPASMYQDVQEMTESATPTELISFTLDESQLSTQIAACSGVLAQYTSGLLCGTYEDVDAVIEKMLSELKASGYDTIIEEANRQVQEYLDERK